MEGQTLHVASGEGKTAWILGQLMTFKLHGASREVGIFEMAIPPGGGAPTHFHRTQEETHILLEGRYEFLLGDRRIQVGPGDIVYIPKGVVHGFTNIGSETGRLLFIETPAGPLERFLEEIGEPVTDDGGPRGLPPDMVKLQAAAERTGGIDFVSSDHQD